ncbi:beta-glucosidase 31-like isoform X1 [Iris pallida]|uniref:Beta-glucosidase 31-like isoform X1 n=1 Tax=Iris pallida TaxID=29817 RepID=A0AAX6EKY4_IRIPA|nr:beta-glucosidase 31-like isoform X1 [Iris pallida]
MTYMNFWNHYIAFSGLDIFKEAFRVFRKITSLQEDSTIFREFRKLPAKVRSEEGYTDLSCGTK